LIGATAAFGSLSSKAILLMQDLNNFESDPEAFAEGLANDLEIDDPEVAVSGAAPAVAGLSFTSTGRQHRRPRRLIDILDS
jgi:hypothetical protein